MKTHVHRPRTLVAATVLAVCGAFAPARAGAQPVADQLIAHYGNDATPYPLYAGVFGEPVQWTAADLRLLGDNFEACYGTPRFTPDQIRTLRARNPSFQVLKYVGNWAIRDYTATEKNHRHDILYYRVGNLAANVSASAIHIELTDMFGGLRAGSAPRETDLSGETSVGFRDVVWLLINDEYVRVDAVDGDRATITRRFAGSQAAAHAAGTPVLAPVYAGPTSGAVRYRHDPGSPLRWQEVLTAAERAHADANVGLWIDIVTGNLSINALTGESVPMNRRWNFHTGRSYDSAEWHRAAESGIRLVQDGFRKRFGAFPVIWGNNLEFPLREDADRPGRLGLLLSTSTKPRPLDGFAQENCYAGYGKAGNSGRTFSWASYQQWQAALQSIMFLGELKVSARPLMLDGGKDNNNFAAEPAAFRDQVLLYGYCSYLLGVKVEPDGRIYTMVGFTPVVGPNRPGARHIELPPFFQWQIGRPIETRRATDFTGYRLPGSTVFQRRFEHGVVLVNPADGGSATVDLDQLYVDPVNGHPVRTVTLPAKTARILLNPPAAAR